MEDTQRLLWPMKRFAATIEYTTIYERSGKVETEEEQEHVASGYSHGCIQRDDGSSEFMISLCLS